MYPIIARWRQAGYRIWFDEGIDPGNEWPEEIAKALAAAAHFVVFVSPRSVESVNCRNEINFAINHRKPFLSVCLEETKLPAGLELRMGDIQAIMKFRMDEESFDRKLSKTLPDTLAGDSVAAEFAEDPSPGRKAPVPSPSGGVGMSGFGFRIKAVIAGIFFLALILGAWTSLASRKPNSLPGLFLATSTVRVEILIPGYETAWNALGTVISRLGLVITNPKIFTQTEGENRGIRVFWYSTGKNHPAKLLAIDPTGDFALLKIQMDGVVPPDPPPILDIIPGLETIPAFSAGMAVDRENDLATRSGSIMGSFLDETRNRRYMSLSLPVQEGDLGGGLYASNGSLIGVVCGRQVSPDGTVRGLAYPARDFFPILASAGYSPR